MAESIDCSAQPLDLAFHPSQKYLVAAALVDGTLEGEFQVGKDVYLVFSL